MQCMGSCACLPGKVLRMINKMQCRFITYDEEGAIEKVFAQGRMHELAGKSVEVKRATPKGTGPSLGRGLIWRGYDQRADRAALEHAGTLQT